MGLVCPIPPAPHGPTTPGFTPAIKSPPASAPTTRLLYLPCLYNPLPFQVKLSK